MQCATVQIQTEPSADNPTGVVTVNESDFDAATMTLWDAPAKPPVEVPPVVVVTPVSNSPVTPPWGKE